MIERCFTLNTLKIISCNFIVIILLFFHIVIKIHYFSVTKFYNTNDSLYKTYARDINSIILSTDYISQHELKSYVA